MKRYFSYNLNIDFFFINQIIWRNNSQNNFISQPIQKHAQIKQEQFNSLPEKHMLFEIRHKAQKKLSRLKNVEKKEWQIRC